MADPIYGHEVTAQPIDVVRNFWAALSSRDWDAVHTFFTDDSEYWDVPIGRENGAIGADNIVARLKLGLEPLASYHNDDEHHVVDGDKVVTVHSETWHWDDDHSYRLEFSTFQTVQGESILEWRDYSDMSGLMAAAPAWWHERLVSADLSFISGNKG